MRRNRVAAMLAMAVFAGALVADGCVSATTKPPVAAATASARLRRLQAARPTS